jgi:Protein of unknown function (DUF3035)
MRGEHGRRYVPAWLRIATLSFCLSVLAGCGQGTVQDALGMGKRSPDEFAVVSRAPLILPPDFDLRPPGRGEAPRPAGTTADQARATLTGGTTEPGQGELPATDPMISAARPASPDDGPAAATARPTSAETPGEAALLRQVGAAGSDPEIRTRLAEEGIGPAEVEPATFERLMSHPADGVQGADGTSPTVVQREQREIDQLVDPEVREPENREPEN